MNEPNDRHACRLKAKDAAAVVPLSVAVELARGCHRLARSLQVYLSRVGALVPRDENYHKLVRMADALEDEAEKTLALERVSLPFAEELPRLEPMV